MIEDIYSGISLSSKIADFSDVKVVNLYGEIPLIQLSRIPDVEMKQFI